MIFKTRQLKGFTLVELTVSVGIFAILFTMILANFRGAEQNNLNSALQKFAGDIREVQTAGLAGQTQDGVYPSGGYGMSLEILGSSTSDYVTFADLNGNVFFDIASDSRLAAGTILKNNYITDMFYSDEVDPAAPDSNLEPFLGWTRVLDNNFLVLTFNNNFVSLEIKPSAAAVSIQPAHVGFLLKNEKTQLQAYLYVSQRTGLISSDLIK